MAIRFWRKDIKKKKSLQKSRKSDLDHRRRMQKKSLIIFHSLWNISLLVTPGCGATGRKAAPALWQPKVSGRLNDAAPTVANIFSRISSLNSHQSRSPWKKLQCRQSVQLDQSAASKKKRRQSTATDLAQCSKHATQPTIG